MMIVINDQEPRRHILAGEVSRGGLTREYCRWSRTATEKEIEAAILKAELASKEEMPEIILETPKEKEHGDYATNMAMQLARIAKKAPKQIAEEIVEQIDTAKHPWKKSISPDRDSLTFLWSVVFDEVVTEINEAKSQ